MSTVEVHEGAATQSPTASDPAGEEDPALHGVTVVPGPEMRPPGHLRGSCQRQEGRVRIGGSAQGGGTGNMRLG